MHHTGGHACIMCVCAAHNGVDMPVTGAVTLVTHSCVRMVERFLDRALSELVGNRAVEMCGPLAYMYIS